MYRSVCVRSVKELLITLMIILLVSCGASKTDDDNEPDGITGTIVENISELFVETPHTDTTVLRTNDEQYRSANGYSVWTVWDEGESDPFTTRTVTLAKNDGQQVAGYGLVLCQTNRLGIGCTMLTIMINVKGQYTIGKFIDGDYNPLVPWTSSSHLYKDYESANTIKVTYDAVSSEYTLTINDNVVQAFKDESEPRHTGGKNGYIVVISPDDDFPAEWVEVSFTETK